MLKNKRKRWVSGLKSYARYLWYRTHYKNPGNPSRELMIDVADITLAIDDRKLSKENAAYNKIYKRVNILIEGGFWDHVKPFDDKNIKLKGFQEHFVRGLAWEDTSLFKGYNKVLKGGGKVQGCWSIEEVIRLYEEHHDPLYLNLKSEGIRSSRGRPDIAPIYVYIHKDGRFVYTSGGNHRLNMAKVLGIQKIPVYVRGRHVEWQNIREELYRLGVADFLKAHPRLSGHPDLFD